MVSRSNSVSPFSNTIRQMWHDRYQTDLVPASYVASTPQQIRAFVDCRQAGPEFHYEVVAFDWAGAAIPPKGYRFSSPVYVGNSTGVQRQRYWRVQQEAGGARPMPGVLYRVRVRPKPAQPFRTPDATPVA